MVETTESRTGPCHARHPKTGDPCRWVSGHAGDRHRIGIGNDIRYWTDDSLPKWTDASLRSTSRDSEAWACDCTAESDETTCGYCGHPNGVNGGWTDTVRDRHAGGVCGFPNPERRRSTSRDSEAWASIDAVADALNAWDQGEPPRPDTARHWSKIVAALMGTPNE